MSIQMPLFQRTNSNPPRGAALAAADLGLPFGIGRFVESFEALADAAGGVLRLRQLILGLALRGSLSPSGAASWRRVKVGDVADCMLGKMLDKAKHTKGVLRPYLRNINVRWGTVDLSDLLEMFFKDDELERYGVRPGDVLICEGGEPGRATVWTDSRPMLIQKALHRVRPSKDVVPAWIVLNLRHDTWSGRLDEFFTGATIKHFTGRALASYEIPLPPLAEQKRIVAKVDQLMALCDELEARQTKKREAGTLLTKSALEALTSAEGPEEFDVAWKRVVENFDVLIDRSTSVSDLRVCILELAVRGKLVGPIISDGSAAALLERIDQDVQSNSRARKRLVGLDTFPFNIPLSWQWVCWGRLVIDTSSGWSPQCEARPRSNDDWGVLKVSAVSWVTFDPDANKALPQGVEPRPEFAVRSGDFLMSRANTAELVGRSVVVATAPKHLILSDKIIRCQFSEWVDKQFVNLYNRTSGARSHYVTHASGTSDSMKNISRDVILSMPVPLPPLAEQQRIVAKVEQLMKICDDLEAKLRRAEDRASKLVEAVVSELVA